MYLKNRTEKKRVINDIIEKYLQKLHTKAYVTKTHTTKAYVTKTQTKRFTSN